MRALIELGSGWWLMVGAYADPEHGPSVTVVSQYDPDHSLPAYGIKAMRFTPEEADELACQLVAAVAQCQGDSPAFLTSRQLKVSPSELSEYEVNKSPGDTSPEGPGGLA